MKIDLVEATFLRRGVVPKVILLFIELVACRGGRGRRHSSLIRWLLSLGRIRPVVTLQNLTGRTCIPVVEVHLLMLVDEPGAVGVSFQPPLHDLCHTPSDQT